MIQEQGCEGAGGPLVNNPAKKADKGGCEQNSDYVANGNQTYRKVCPAAVLKGQSSAATSVQSIISTLISMIVFSTTLPFVF